MSGEAEKDGMQRGKKKIENIVKMFFEIYAPQLGAINMNGGLTSVPIPSQFGKLYQGTNGINHINIHIKTWLLHTYKILCV
jgi:hypothetical protein